MSITRSRVGGEKLQHIKTQSRSNSQNENTDVHFNGPSDQNNIDLEEGTKKVEIICIN